MKALIEFNYQTIVNRGLINDNTTDEDFINKIEEESIEFEKALILGEGSPKEELSDIILVCLNFARHNGIDIESELIKKICLNSNR